MKFIPHLLFCLLLISCTYKNESRIDAEPRIEYDSIVSILPNYMKVKDSIFIWQDGFAKEGNPFLNVINLNSKTEVAKGGKIGRGPGEFVSPIIGKTLTSDLFIYDMNNVYQTIIGIDNIQYPDSCSPVKFPYRDFTTQSILLSNSELISLCPDEEAHLIYDTPDTTVQFGVSPFGQSVSNALYVLQGLIDYNPTNQVFAHALYQFPYIALYKKDDTFGFVLEREIKSDMHFTNTQGKIISGEPNKRGIFDLALTKDYIVTIQRDYEVDNIDERNLGGNTERAPSTLFVYNYNGEFLKIINLGVPLLRLEGSFKNNKVYSIATMVDYALISFDLDSVLNPN